LCYCSGDCAPVNGQPQPDGLYVSTQDGIIYVANPAGIIELAIGQAAFVANRETPPQPIDTPPLLLPPADDGSGTPVYVAGEQTSSDSDIPAMLFTPRSVFDDFAAQDLVGFYNGTGGSATDQFGNQGQISSAGMSVYFANATLNGYANIIFPTMPNSDINLTFMGDFLSGTTLFTGTGDDEITPISDLNVSGGLLGPTAEGAILNFDYADGSKEVEGTIVFELSGLAGP
jgi:hypothetical protein